jgi:glutamate 5-kinase
MKNRSELAGTRRLIVKIGSTLLTGGGRGLDVHAIGGWVSQIATLRQRGMEIILVSSGSVAEGMSRLGWKTRPESLHELQAAAAVGQMGLIQTYESLFKHHGFHAAQVLLTHEDLSDRQRYLNARSTLRTLLQLGVVPVINENDTVATEEIRFGDNDTLSALVANLVEADLLVILTDQAGLFDSDPGLNPAAQLVSQASASDSTLLEIAGGSRSGLGRGGMFTKVRAARLAGRSGTATLIAPGAAAEVLLKAVDGESVGTFLVPDMEPLVARKRWLAGRLQVKGAFTLDEGAARVLVKAGKSLLPIGVIAVQGDFQRGELVACRDEAGREIACGLTNYGTDDARKIIRQPSSRIAELLGYVDEPELIHRDNLVLV